MPITDKKKKITLWQTPTCLFKRSRKIGEYEANTYDDAVEKYAAENRSVEITVTKFYKIGSDDITYQEDY